MHLLAIQPPLEQRLELLKLRGQTILFGSLKLCEARLRLTLEPLCDHLWEVERQGVTLLRRGELAELLKLWILHHQPDLTLGLRLACLCWVCVDLSTAASTGAKTGAETGAVGHVYPRCASQATQLVTISACSQLVAISTRSASNPTIWIADRAAICAYRACVACRTDWSTRMVECAVSVDRITGSRNGTNALLTGQGILNA
mmetsp:Transcript_48714/g.127308  ORF Transcript_48714/g.127308 Transcript_48714/m.127308 type:complete len:202 (+) Transcript_48714:335-940(+)